MLPQRTKARPEGAQSSPHICGVFVYDQIKEKFDLFFSFTLLKTPQICGCALGALCTRFGRALGGTQSAPHICSVFNQCTEGDRTVAEGRAVALRWPFRQVRFSLFLQIIRPDAGPRRVPFNTFSCWRTGTPSTTNWKRSDQCVSGAGRRTTTACNSAMNYLQEQTMNLENRPHILTLLVAFSNVRKASHLSESERCE